MASVYVGTYKKYNNGNLAGGWVNIDKCEKYEDFLSACANLHKDETDPEFMIQDYDDLPDGLSIMEWMTREEFADIKQAMQPAVTIREYSAKSFVVVGDTYPIKNDLKRLGGTWFRKEQGWLFPLSKKESVSAYLNGAEIEAKPNEPKDNRFSDWLKEFINTECKNDSDTKYYNKEYVGAIKIDGHFYLIDKPSIENKFCFHDEGADYEFYKELHADESKMRQYFIDRNESSFTRMIDGIKNGEDVEIRTSDYMHQLAVYVGRHYYDPQQGRPATEEEKKLILEGLQFGLDKFRTRLNAYLKRYGLSKLHTWTYWADA